MRSSRQTSEQLASDRDAIVRSGKLHWAHWCVIGLSLLATLAAWQFAKRQVEATNQAQFDRAASQVVELVKERMQNYEEGLWGGVAAIRANGGHMSRGEWREFASALRIDLRFPGINGIGVIDNVPAGDVTAYLEEHQYVLPGFRIHPSHANPDRFPITYIEPAASNAAAIGLDVAHETNRYTAALKARDSGEAQITGPIVLAQDQEKKPGFLFYAPIYKNTPDTGDAAHREQFIGFVYAPFVFHKLIAGPLRKDNRQVRVRVSDGNDALYDERDPESAEFDETPEFQDKRQLELYGRTWNFDVWTTKTFRAENSSGQPGAILIAGFIVEALLILLFVMLTRANRRAIQFVDMTTEALQERTIDLQKTNVELERFAYVASHDLRAPLRGITSLATWIEEDTREHASDAVQANTKLLHGRIKRMETLLDDLLHYSRAGQDMVEAEAIDLEVELSELFKLLSPPNGVNLVLEKPLPKLTTGRTPLEQIFQNLIQNAIKHNDSQSGAIKISARDLGAMWEFTVQDDGPGIAPEYHAKVFTIFQTLKGRDEVEGSGIGLSIVQRIVESVKGEIRIESDPDKTRGTAFRFTWPKHWAAASDFKQAA